MFYLFIPVDCMVYLLSEKNIWRFNMANKIRVLVAKSGLDGHDRGAKIVAAALRDAGMEVIYTGLRQSADMIVEAAIQEDVHAIGVSVLSGAHNTIFKKILTIMKEKGVDDVLLFGGGIIPEEDIKNLKEMGVGELFTPGASTEEISNYVKKWVEEHPRELA